MSRKFQSVNDSKKEDISWINTLNAKDPTFASLILWISSLFQKRLHWLNVQVDYMPSLTLVSFMQLPDYSNEEVLKQRLMAATMEKGFHLN